MQSISHLAIVAAAFSIVLGVPFGLYAVLTRGQRRDSREIRAAAFERGWKYASRYLGGDPTAFRIDGQTTNGLTWIMISEGSAGRDCGWTVQLGLRFPTLGGEKDFEIEPRRPGSYTSTSLGSADTQGVRDRVAALSEVVAADIGFRRESCEFVSGLAVFDSAYRVLAVPRRVRESPVDTALAKRVLEWPPHTVQPHSMLSWRDPFGFHVQARLPAPPNWATACYLLALAEDLVRRTPAPVISPLSPTLIDRIFARFTRS